MKKFFNWWKTQSILKKLLYSFTTSLICTLIITMELIPSSLNNSFPPLGMLITLIYVIGFPWFTNILLYKLILKKLNSKNLKRISWVLFFVGWYFITLFFGEPDNFIQFIEGLLVLFGFNSMFYLMINGYPGKIFIVGTIGQEGLERLKDKLYKN
ncbi:hypothetical protein OAV50_00070 [Flavobacteriaceae bacterium]|nr:hypothetical protein [Flavobacteriaceae bacterium]